MGDREVEIVQSGSTGGHEVRAAPGPVLRSQDLVSLPVLRALLRERNVTRAGELVGLSQPATSAALARLRRRFGDELLVRVGREYELTPLAVGLLVRLEAATEALERLYGDEFDPATSTREFTLAVSDYVVAVLFESFNHILADEAPGVTLDLRPLNTLSHLDADALLRQSDAVVLPHELVQGYPAEQLIRDRWVCIVADSNDAVADELTVEDLAALPWVSPYSRLDPATFPALRRLRSRGIEPHVEIVTDSFLTVPFLVAGSNRVAFLQERLARRLVAVSPVRVVASPLEMGELRLSLRWHPAVTDDPGHRWLRGALLRAAATLTD